MRFKFEDFSLDTERRELRRGARTVPLEPQAFDLLAYLIAHRARVVSKDELNAAVWGGRFVSDSSLSTRVNTIRSALADSGAEQRLIRTFPRKGLRFVGAANEDAHSPGAQPILAIRDRPSIAVLPFTNLSTDPDQAFIGNGLAEDVLTELSKLRWLFVAARNASVVFSSAERDLKQAGEALGVRYVLAGSVRRSNGQIRIAAQLADVPGGNHIWADRYDRAFVDIFAVQDEITKAVAGAIGPAIVDAERQRALRKPPENLEAWEAYQRGLWHMTKHSTAENETARSLFQRAVELDPRFAAAHSALALTYLMSVSVFSSIDYAEGCRLGEELVRKAISLDGGDADARGRLSIALFLRGDLEGAILEADCALEINANCTDALGAKAGALIFSGRREEGRQFLQQFLSASPRDPIRPVRMTQFATSLYLDKDYEGAERVAKQVIRQYPGSMAAHRWLAASLGQLGREAEAQKTLRTFLDMSPYSANQFINRAPFFGIDDYQHMLEGLRKAGWAD